MLPDVRLDFVPARVTSVGSTVVIIPFAMGRYAQSLLYVLDGDVVVPQKIQPQEFANVSVMMLANALSVAELDGRLLLAHQFMMPRAYLWRPGATPAVRAVPLPREVMNSIGYVPPLPLDSAALRPLLAVAVSLAADVSKHRFVFLTRSGRMINGRFEKVLVRTDSALNHLDSFRLPISAGHLALLDAGRTAVLVDEDGGWHTCPLP